jgi:glyoxylase-like metal-dependent hydrolase (beta-lactamase superfamily II)
MINKVALAVLALSISFSLLGAAETGDIELKIDVNRLSERVIVLTTEEISNSVIAIASHKGIVVIDTHISPPFAKAMRAAIAREFGRDDFAYTINTHDHGDHTYGNQVFADTTIIAHDNCPVEMRREAENLGATIENYRSALDRMKSRIDSMDRDSDEARARMKQYEILKLCVDGWEEGFVLTTPTMTFNDRLTLDLGDVSLKLVYFGKAHSISDILIHVPEENLLLVGDITYSNGSPSITSELVPELPRWISVLEEVLHGDGAVKQIVNGHNNFITVEDMESQLAYIKAQYEYTKGKESFLAVLEKALQESGIESAQQAYGKFKAEGAGKYYLLEGEANGLGYGLLQEGNNAEAIAVFKMIVDYYPDSWNAWDSLGEAYMTDGETDLAIESYTKSLALNPDNDNATRQIESMKQEERN